jgi:hypothetical protein
LPVQIILRHADWWSKFENDFDGALDLSKRSKYDFQINVLNADLKEKKLMKDPISVFEMLKYKHLGIQ